MNQPLEVEELRLGKGLKGSSGVQTQFCSRHSKEREFREHTHPGQEVYLSSLTSGRSLSLLLPCGVPHPAALSPRYTPGSGRCLQDKTQRLGNEFLPRKLTNLREGRFHPQKSGVPGCKGLRAVAARPLCSISQLNKKNRIYTPRTFRGAELEWGDGWCYND